MDTSTDPHEKAVARATFARETHAASIISHRGLSRFMQGIDHLPLLTCGTTNG
jgi:hypothetical protein